MRQGRLFIAVLICSAACASAQNASQVASQDAPERKAPDTSEKANPFGTVTGHVYLVPVPRAEGSMGPPQFNTRLLHQYGATSIFLHVDRDMDGVTIAVPEPTAKEAQAYKEMMQQQENQQNQPSAPR